MPLVHRRSAPMKPHLRHCAIGWRKVFFAAAMMTVGGLVLQIFSRGEIASVSEPLITVTLRERFENSRTPNVSVAVEPAEVRRSESRRTKKRSKEVANLKTLIPSPPRRKVPYRLQVPINSCFPCENRN